MKRLEFHISYICTHKCIFCSESDRMTNFKNHPLTLLQIKTILVDRRKKWFNHINFTWGEPTLIPWFLDLLKFTKKLGYKIYVWTNWTLFYSEKFASEALKYIDELSLSVHWYSPDTCEKQTWLKTHFNNFPTIVKNIEKYKQDNFLFLNIVINKHNYKEVNKVIDFVIITWYNFKQVLVSNIAPEWQARHDFRELVFDLNDLVKDIPKIIEKCNKNSKILRFFWLPTCILWEELKEYSNDLHWQERHTIERFKTSDWKIKLIDVYSPDNSRERTFVEKCNNCKWKDSPCTWIFEKYLDFYKF